MNKKKKTRLEKAGWEVGSVGQFLDLSPEEREFIELKLALSRSIRELRVEHGWTQSYVAKRIGSSQSRIAKMEAGDSSVSVDLLVKALLFLGASREDVADIIATAA